MGTSTLSTAPNTSQSVLPAFSSVTAFQVIGVRRSNTARFAESRLQRYGVSFQHCFSIFSFSTELRCHSNTARADRKSSLINARTFRRCHSAFGNIRSLPARIESKIFRQAAADAKRTVPCRSAFLPTSRRLGIRRIRNAHKEIAAFQVPPTHFYLHRRYNSQYRPAFSRCRLSMLLQSETSDNYQIIVNLQAFDVDSRERNYTSMKCFQHLRTRISKDFSSRCAYLPDSIFLPSHGLFQFIRR